MPEESQSINHLSQTSCQICGRQFDSGDLVPLEIIRPGVASLIEKDHPSRAEERTLVCEDDLNRYRRRYTQSLIEEEKGEITALEEEVLQSLHNRTC